MGTLENLIIPRLNIRTMVPVYLIETRVFAPVLSVLSVDKNRLDKTQIFYKTVLRTRLSEEVWERGVLNYGVKIVNS